MENKFNKIASMFESVSSRMTFNQKSSAKNLLELLLTDISKAQINNEILKARLLKMKPDEYKNSLDKTISILKCLDLNLVEIQMIEKEETDFYILHVDSIKKTGKITIERFMNIIKLVRFFKQTEFRMPNSLNELTSKYNELKQLRE